MFLSARLMVFSMTIHSYSDPDKVIKKKPAEASDENITTPCKIDLYRKLQKNAQAMNRLRISSEIANFVSISDNEAFRKAMFGYNMAVIRVDTLSQTRVPVRYGAGFANIAHVFSVRPLFLWARTIASKKVIQSFGAYWETAILAVPLSAVKQNFAIYSVDPDSSRKFSNNIGHLIDKYPSDVLRRLRGFGAAEEGRRQRVQYMNNEFQNLHDRSDKLQKVFRPLVKKHYCMP